MNIFFNQIPTSRHMTITSKSVKIDMIQYERHLVNDAVLVPPFEAFILPNNIFLSAIPQSFHTRKLDKILLFYTVHVYQIISAKLLYQRQYSQKSRKIRKNMRTN